MNAKELFRKELNPADCWSEQTISFDFNDVTEFAERYLEHKLKLLGIGGVSQQRELLVAYEKQHYTPSDWALASKQCEKEIDEFLATNCG